VTGEITNLIQRAARGEKAAWDALVEQYKRLTWGILGKFGNSLSRAEQEDLFQDAFVILLDGGLQRFRGSSEYEFRAYLARIVRNEVYTWIRDRDRHGKIEILESSLSEQEDE
jgi:RNA polymerase sigma factor (sigma-70 family)